MSIAPAVFSWWRFTRRRMPLCSTSMEFYHGNNRPALPRPAKQAHCDGKSAPVFARVMRSKEGKFEGVSFIKNKEKATVMTAAEAQEVVTWAAKKKENAQQYETKVICVGQ